MTRNESWNEYLDSMIGIVSEEFRGTKEHAFEREKQDMLEQWIESLYPEEKQKFFENCAFEQLLDAERRAEYYYQQGLKDGVSILKKLGVLA